MRFRPYLFALLLLAGRASAGSYTLLSETMIRELDPARFNADFSRYHQPTALFCGQLADAAYLTATDVPLLERRLNAAYGGGRFRIADIESRSTRARALVCATRDFTVVAFRGTDFFEPKDLLTDLKIIRYAAGDAAPRYVKDIPPCHGGFRRGLSALITEAHLLDTIRQLQQQYRQSADPAALPVYTTGHSMGAAYATLASWPLQDSFRFGGAYNFAPPLAVSCEAAGSVLEKQGRLIHDVVHYKDYVPRASQYCRRYMRHFGHFYRVSPAGTLTKEDECYVRWKRSEYGVATVIQYHSLNGYLAAVRSAGNSTDSVRRREAAGTVFFGTGYRRPSCREGARLASRIRGGR